VRVLIVDDQEFIRRGIRAVLSDASEIEVCGEAVDGHEAILKARQLKPDVVVMDISMPRLDGLEATREIRKSLPRVRVLTLSQYELPDVMREALEAGAATHVSKIYIWTQLVPALRRVELGHTFFDGNFAGTFEEELGDIRRSRAALEKALQESEERFRCAFELTSSGIGHIGEDGKILRVNQRLCEMLGYNKEEMQNLRLQDITHPADLAGDLAMAARVTAGEVDHYAIETRYLCKAGGIASVRMNVHAVRRSDGTLQYCIRVAEDTAEQKDAELKLTRAKHDLEIATAQLDLVSNRMALALTHCSRDLRYVWVNQNYANWLDRPVERIIGRPIRDVIGSQAFQKLQPHLEIVLSGQKVEYEDCVSFPQIGERHISAAYEPTYDASGVPDGWISMLQDVSGRRQSTVSMPLSAGI
jgi:PAS domain S-box-containing protein